MREITRNVMHAMLAMQRHPWEQGVCGQALFEAGEENLWVSAALDSVKRQDRLGKSRRVLAPDTGVCAFLNVISSHKARRQQIGHLVQLCPCAAPVFKFNCCLLSDSRCCLFETSADRLLNQFHWCLRYACAAGSRRQVSLPASGFYDRYIKEGP